MRRNLTVSIMAAEGRGTWMGRGVGMAPVDATSTHEWEADRANRLGAGLLFWFWYLPNDVIRWRSALRTAARTLLTGRALLRYPLITPPAHRAAAKAPVRSPSSGGSGCAHT